MIMQLKWKVLVGVLAFVPLIGAQNQAAKTEPVAARATSGLSTEVGEAILAELRQIRMLLEKQQPVPQAAPAVESMKISAAGFSLGRADAPLTLVEFADYQCTFCRQFHSVVYEQLKKDYIDTGKLRFVSRDLPLDGHSNANGAANAARCAGEQDKFWQMRDVMIAHADKLEREAIRGYAQTIGLGMVSFDACVASGRHLDAIRADVAEATAAGVAGTPTFVLGKTAADTIQGLKLVGAQSYETFEKMLNELTAK